MAVPAPPERELIWFRRPRGRRGPKPTLSRDQITKRAVELADTEGLEAVSMRKLAAKLDAGTTSLYWHVQSKNDLHELMVDQVVGEIRLPEPTGDWRADLRALALASYETLGRHRWIVLVGIQPGLGPKTRRYGDVALRVFEPLELELATAINVLAALNNYIFGFIHREIAWEQLRERNGLDEQGWKAHLHAYLEEAGGEDAGVAEHMAERFRLISRESFEFGLDCLLAGIAERIKGGHSPKRSELPEHPVDAAAT